MTQHNKHARCAAVAILVILALAQGCCRLKGNSNESSPVLDGSENAIGINNDEIDSDIQHWIEHLGSKNHWKSRNAVQELKRIGEPAVDCLLKALDCENITMRNNAAQALGEIGSKRAEKYLLTALVQDNNSAAALALGKIGAEDALEFLVNALSSDDPTMRLLSARAIGFIGADNSAVRLLHLLQDASYQVRREAIIALGKLRDPASVPKLLAMSDVCDDNELYWIALSLQEIGSAGSPYLISHLEKSKIKRTNLIEALGKIGGDGALDCLIEIAISDNHDAKLEAITALGQLRDENAISILTRFANDEHQEIRIYAICALGKIGCPGAIPIIANQLEDEVAAPYAAKALGDIKHRDAVPYLVKSLSSNQKSTVLAAIEALGKINDSRAFPPLISLIDAKDEDIKTESIIALEKMTGQNFGPHSDIWKSWIGENKK